MIPLQAPANAPCPCKSGLRFKQCCMLNQQSNSHEIAWRKLRDCYSSMLRTLMPYVAKKYGPEGHAQAWIEFTQDSGVEPDPELPETPAFFSYFFYHWPVGPNGEPPATLYLEEKGNYLAPFERRYLAACLSEPFSFFEVMEIRPGEGFRARDILLEQEVDIIEKQGSHEAVRGAVFFGKIVTLDSVSFAEVMYPAYFSPLAKARILELRKDMKEELWPLTASLLRKLEVEVLDVFWMLLEEVRDPQSPILTNTDGDPILHEKIIYRITSAQEVLDRLKHLVQEVDKQYDFSDAERDSDGSLVRVEFPWLQAGNRTQSEWDNTVLGHIRIERDRMEIEVNSTKRAGRIKGIITRRLKGVAHLESAVVLPPSDKVPEPVRAEDLPPEVLEKYRASAKSRWERWVDLEIPALGGKTPKQALDDPEDREMLEALLTDIESKADRALGDSAENVREVRRKLGL